MLFSKIKQALCLLVASAALITFTSVQNHISALEIKQDNDTEVLSSDNFCDLFGQEGTVYILPNSKNTHGKDIDNRLTGIPFTKTEQIGEISTLIVYVDSDFLSEYGLTAREFFTMLGCNEQTISQAVNTIENGGVYYFSFEIFTAYLTTQKPSSNDTTDTDNLIIIVSDYGDVNCDGNVTMEDVTSLQKIIAKLCTHEQFGSDSKINSDVNHDDSISMADVTTIQKYIAKLIKDF